MPKELTASVKLNTSDAERKLKRLADGISRINQAINGKSTNAVERSLDKQLIAAQKLRKATADAEAAELRVAAAKEKQAQIAQKNVDAEVKAAQRQVQLELDAQRQKQQATWRAFQAEQAAYEQMIARKKQADLDITRNKVVQNSHRIQQERAQEERLHQDEMAKMRKKYQAEERAAKQLAKQEERLKEKQHRQELRRIQEELKQRQKAAKELRNDVLSKVKGVLSAYLGTMTLNLMINTSDVITSAENKLNYINGGDKNATQEQMDTMYAVAQEARMKYSDMMANVSKSMTLAPDAFNGNINNAIRFQEIMAKAYTLGGASAAEMSSSMYQLIQGLGSGVLQGDELRSVREGASLAYKEIEKFAQGIYGADKNLKDLASDGLITSDIVVAAIMDAGTKIDGAFDETDMTFAQVGTNIKNSFTKAIEPGLQKLNDGLNKLVENGFVDDLTVIFEALGKVVYWVGSAFDWIGRNWEYLRIIIVPLLVLIGLLTGALIVYAVSQALVDFWNKKIMASGFLAWIAPLLPIFLVIAAIILVIMILKKCGVSFAEVAGFIVGIIAWVAATIWNIIAGVINAIIEFLWTMLAVPVISIVEFIANAFGGGFDSIGDAFNNLLGNMLSWLVGFAKIATKIIDAVFGSNFTGEISKLQDKLTSVGKNEEAITISREAPTLQRASASNWYNASSDWVTNKLSSVGGGGGTDPEDPLSKYKYDEEIAYEKATADNTGKIADSMELTAEDLEYLRKIANMEWKKEFTTANITVDMTNNNTVSNDFDLISLATSLRGLVEEEMYVLADGTYNY